MNDDIQLLDEARSLRYRLGQQMVAAMGRVRQMSDMARVHRLHRISERAGQREQRRHETVIAILEAEREEMADAAYEMRQEGH